MLHALLKRPERNQNTRERRNKMEAIRYFLLFFIFGIMTAVMSGCTGNEPISIKNVPKIIGVVINNNSVPQKDISVYLLNRPQSITKNNTNIDSCSYIVKTVLTDLNGLFAFDSIPSGEYWVEVKGQGSEYAWLSCGNYSNNKVLDLGKIILKGIASIKGQIISDQAWSQSGFSVFITSPYSSIIRADTNGLFSITPLCNGIYSFLVIPTYSVDFPNFVGWDTTIQISDTGTIDLGIILMGNRQTTTFSTGYYIQMAAVQAMLDSNGSSILPEDITYVNDNKIVYLFDSGDLKKITSDIEALTSLEWITIYNHTMDTLPVSITKLKNLRFLYLGNGLLSSIPDNMNQMTSLEFFDVDKNKFSSVPISLMSLPRLFSVCFSNNNICNPSPEVEVFLDKYDISFNSWRTTQICIAQ
jgi:Leucine-rich repeat (LRR) protein